MPIDASETRSPGWWLARLARKLESRQPRLSRLNAYLEGNPPLPEGAENAKRAYQAFQRKARTNYAEMVVEAKRTRMIPLGFRTAAAGDENGDDLAAQIWHENGLDVEWSGVAQSMLGLGDGYMIVGRDDTGDGRPVITAEDPRQVVTEHDPRRQRRVVASLKMFSDETAGLDLAYLYLPGQVWVARRETKPPTLAGQNLLSPFALAAWDWDGDLSGPLPAGFDDVVPVVRFRNRNGVGEFERHLDHLDRINHMLLQRMVIATVQAFKQRAIKGDLPSVYPKGHPNAGDPIDYDALFTADPGALWMIPGAAEMWESGQVDLTPILSSVKDDVRDLAAVTFTPLYFITPDAANGSAEGASTQREALVFQCDDRIARATDGLAQVMSLAFRFLGDAQRADLGQLRPMWLPPERYSLAERYDAASKAKAIGVPWRSIMLDILQFRPDAVARMEAEQSASAVAPELAKVDAANMLMQRDGLSQGAAFATVGLLQAASQISTGAPTAQ